MKNFLSLFMTLCFLSLPAQAELTEQDYNTFKALHGETMTKGKFRVLNKSTVVGELDKTPFQERINEIAEALIETGMNPNEANKRAVDIFLEEMTRKNLSVANFKSNFRSVDNDFCHQVTGVCLSQQNPELLGKRPSRGQVPYFFPGDYLKKVGDLKTSASIMGKEQPWSDDYWAIQDGILGFRYADNEAYQDNWQNSAQYVLEKRNHLLSILDLAEGSEKDKIIKALSPSEKYDLLIGNIEENQYESWFEYLNNPEYEAGMNLFGMMGGFLTPHHWSQGQAYYDKHGEVESWMGICHGWATASMHLPRPEQGVKAIAFDGKTEITFYPSDIKALGSLLWAESAPRSRFIGGRCNDKEVETDPESGAIINEKCFDTNPGDWHLVIANYLGEMQQSFIMDATFDYAVWNQPVLSYDLVYFNVKTQERSQNYQDVAVNWEDIKDEDPFRNVRGEDSRRRQIVGVDMKVKYLAETRPTQTWEDSFLSDKIISAYYNYDLELDENGQIIGGEWYNNEHPDFLWVHDFGQKAISQYEQFYAAAIDELLYQNYQNGELHFEQPIAAGLTEYAKAAARRGEVTAFVVEALFSEARKN